MNFFHLLLKILTLFSDFFKFYKFLQKGTVNFFDPDRFGPSNTCPKLVYKSLCWYILLALITSQIWCVAEAEIRHLDQKIHCTLATYFRQTKYRICARLRPVFGFWKTLDFWGGKNSNSWSKVCGVSSRAATKRQVRRNLAEIR